MNSADSPRIPQVSAAAARQIDAMCDTLEDALQSGRAYQLEDCLASVDASLQAALLRQLLLLEWEYLQDRNQCIEPTDYCNRFPEHVTAIREAAQEYTLELESRRGAVVNLPLIPEELSPQAKQDWEARGYSIQGRLGRGGMGAVYLARQIAADRLVALKVLPQRSADDERGLDRFRREVQTLARLQHPHIVPIYEVGEHLGRPFFSMEYCAAGSLAEYLRETRPTPAETAQLVETLARAVHVAHQAKIIHRDLKPSNVLLQSRAGRVQTDGPSETVPIGDAILKLADFGLAKRLEEVAQTHTGVVMGTPQYMAPEQARGENKSVGVAADVHALGAILYECLAGRPAFVGSTVFDTVRKVVTDNPLPPTRFIPSVPRDLETICLKCLQKEPRQRYASAVAIAEELRRFRNGEAILARPVGTTERAWKLVRRHPAAIALLFMLACCGTLGLIVIRNNTHSRDLKPGISVDRTGRDTSVTASRTIFDEPLDNEITTTRPHGATDQNASSTSLDRRVAERVIELGGHVDVRTEDGQSFETGRIEELPVSPFDVTWIMMPKNKQVDDNLMSEFEPLTHLVGIDLYATPLTDDGALCLARIPTLAFVYVHATTVGDRGATALAQLPRLQTLIIQGTGITDTTLAALAGNRSVTRLDISSTSISNDGLRHLATITFLESLKLGNTSVSDEGLKHLASLDHVREMSIGGSNITEQGLGWVADWPLESLVITAEQLTPEGVTRFELQHPNCHLVIE